MIFIYELAAIGVVAFAAVAIWHNVQVQRRVHSIDVRLAKMQREIEVLQMQESSRVMRAVKAHSNLESPHLDPVDSSDVESDVVRMIGKPRPTPVP